MRSVPPQLLLLCASAGLLCAGAGSALAQGAPEPARPGAPQPEAQQAAPAKPGFLGVGLEAKALGGESPLACPAVANVVPGSAAELAGLLPGDELRALDGESLLAPVAEVVAGFVKRVKGRPAGTRIKLLISRQTVAVRTTLDEQPLDEAREGSGPHAAARVLPDLEELLGRHPDGLLGVRVRRYARERELLVVLGARPEDTAVVLPPAASLRPAWAAAPLAPGAALAQRVLDLGIAPVQSAYRVVRERLEGDERREDPYRLNAVRFLHREPLRLEGATRLLGDQLREVVSAPGGAAPASGLLALGRDLLDLPPQTAPVTTLVPPSVGTDANGHLTYCLSVVDAAEAEVARAFAGLSADERRQLETSLLEVALVFAQGKYLHTDDDPLRWERNRAALALLPRVDRAALVRALATLCRLAEPAYLAQLRADLQASERRGLCPFGSARASGPLLALNDAQRGIIGASGKNTYRGEDLRVIVDLDGDDVYLTPAAGARPGLPAAVVIDLGGDDRYQSTVRFAQGSAFMGAALLVDLAGDDRYTSQADFAQGSALCGAALLLDEQGDDVYRGAVYAQGSALAWGLAGLVDRGGADRYEGAVYAQGFAGPGSVGVLADRGGDDAYAALGRAPSGYGTPHAFRGMSQGASFGFRHVASGGVGVLFDDGGRDRYEAGNFSQGGGYYYAWGALIDRGQGDDRYEGSRYAQGWAAHSALGSLWDEGGDDRYLGWVGANAGAAWDLSATCFLEDAGDDRYEVGPGFGPGASAHNGLSLFVDRGGADRYEMQVGQAGPNDYHGGLSLSFFFDAGGQADRYAGGLADGTGAVDGQTSARLDLPVPLEAADEALLRRLLQRP
ncbi:MAG: PDZ domain-containing protein [Planctomycetota bacterium]